MKDLPSDRTGWRRLVARVARRTRQPQNAEDLVHSAYLRLEAYRERQAVQSPEAFLVRTAVNLAVDQGRHEKVRNESPLFTAEVFEVEDGHPLQDEALLVKERLAHVAKGIEKLPARTREVFLLHRVEGMKYREIAAQLRVSASTVEKEIAKAVLFLSGWVKDW